MLEGGRGRGRRRAEARTGCVGLRFVYAVLGAASRCRSNSRFLAALDLRRGPVGIYVYNNNIIYNRASLNKYG